MPIKCLSIPQIIWLTIISLDILTVYRSKKFECHGVGVFEKATKCLEDNKAQVTKLVTDRHMQVSAYMANEKPDIEHAYDVWHVAKGTQQLQGYKVMKPGNVT